MYILSRTAVQECKENIWDTHKFSWLFRNLFISLALIPDVGMMFLYMFTLSFAYMYETPCFRAVIWDSRVCYTAPPKKKKSRENDQVPYACMYTLSQWKLINLIQ